MPNISNIVRKHWNILNISRTLQGLFQEEPITTFKRNRNLKELIGSNCICSQLTSTMTFISQQTKRKFKIYHNCKSEYVIYLMECTLCNKQYVGKTETAFNIRLNNQRKDTQNSNAILPCRHFQEQGHNFNSQTKFIIIDKLVNTSSPKDILRERLIQRENFWIQKPKTLIPYGLNQELSK